MYPTLAAATVDLLGAPDNAKAAAAPTKATMSGLVSWSKFNKVHIICVSLK